MNLQSRRWLLTSALLGVLAIALGAFGAHGVPNYLETHGFDATAIAKRLDNFNTAARYHIYAALFLLGVAICMDRIDSRAVRSAAWCMLVGATIFCGALYAVALVPDNLRSSFGMLAPVGGSFMIAAWVALAIGAMNKQE